LKHQLSVLPPSQTQTKKGVKLVVQVPGNIPYVLGDVGRIIQIFHNLIGNACKFTHSGQICIGAVRKGTDVSAKRGVMFSLHRGSVEGHDGLEGCDANVRLLNTHVHTLLSLKL
jgi:signal transduction histidine kinase